MFLLLAENGTALLPTVRSRCELLSLTPLSRQEAEHWLKLRFPKVSPEAVTAAGHSQRRSIGPRSGRAVPARIREIRNWSVLRNDFWTLCPPGDELGRMEMAISLEKWDRDRLAELLDILRSQVCQKLSQPPV